MLSCFYVVQTNQAESPLLLTLFCIAASHPGAESPAFCCLYYFYGRFQVNIVLKVTDKW